MKPLFPNVAILGLGLIGGSIALDLKRLRLADRVVGYNRSATSRRIALKRRACDRVTADPAEAVRDADLVILATPVRNIPALAKKIAAGLKPGALVTDVGSTKEGVVRAAAKALGARATFIGGHPIAGTEHSGMAAAQSKLFEKRWWILTPGKGEASRKALARLTRLVKALGAVPAVLDPREHDQALAAVSHLPHLVAYALMNATRKFPKNLRFAGSSFRDGTRVAASSAEMWTDICLENRAALLAWLARYERELREMKRAVANGDAKRLQRWFRQGAEARRRL